MRKFITLLLFASVALSSSAPRAEVSKSTAATAVLAVRSLESPGAVELRWHAVKGVSKYRVSASRESGDNWHDLGVTGDTKYQLNELAERAKYYFRIASHAPSGASTWGGEMVQYSAQTKEFRPALLLPANFRIKKTSAIAKGAISGSQGELVLVWNTVAGAKSYIVQICESKAGGAARREAGLSGRLIPDEDFRDLTAVRGTEHLVTGLISGKLYFFRIMGVDETGHLAAEK